MFGSRLLELRKQRGFSQAELAELLHTKAPVIGRYERSEAVPSIEVAFRLAKILGSSLDYLCGLSDIQFDRPIIKRLEEVTSMESDQKDFILKALDALVRDSRTQKAYAS